MEKYLEFNCNKFLKDSRYWESKIKELEKEIDSITELHPPSMAPGHSGKPSDPVGDTVERLTSLKAQLQRLRTYSQALSTALYCLSDRQKEVIELFYFKQGHISHAVDKYAIKHGICRSYVYVEKREAVDKITRIINELYFT